MARLRRAIAALVLGAIACALIAWGIDFADQQHKRSTNTTQLRVEPNLSPSPRWKWFVTPDHHVGHRKYTFRLGLIDSNRDAEYAASLDVATVDDFPGWVRVPSSGMHLESHAFGLPFPCLARQNVNANHPRDLVAFRAFGERRMIATRPIWMGLLANALLLGAVLYPLTLLPVLNQRRKRRRRGLCVGCGYDLRGATGKRCPECGRLNTKLRHHTPPDQKQSTPVEAHRR